MNLGSLIDRMIAAGMSPGDAGSVAAEIYAAGASSAANKSSNAERQQRYRDRKRNETVTNRNDVVTDRNDETVTQTVTNRNEALRCDANAVSPIDTNNKKGKRQNSDRSSRGTRIDPDWRPSSAEEQFALGEGFSQTELTREASRFRDYWKGRAGSGGVKLDWTATWQNWIRTSADKLGKTPRSPSTQAAETGFYAAFGSEEQDAWDRYGQAQRGKSFPRDNKGGWRHPTRWPPGYTPPEKSHERPPAPILRTMQ